MESLKKLFFSTGGWREREKAREESWGPPRGDHNDDGDDDDGDRRGERGFRDRRPPRCFFLIVFIVMMAMNVQ